MNVNEVDVEAVDPRDELRQRIQLRFRLPPVVASAPILDEGFYHRELYALRLVVDGLSVGPPCRRDATTEIEELLFRKINAEGAYRVAFGCFSHAGWKHIQRSCDSRRNEEIAPVRE